MEPGKLREYIMNGVVHVVQLTPFKDNEDVDFDALRQNTEFLVEKRHYGPMFLTPVGSTGEKYAVNDEEWKRIVRTVVDVTNGKIPVVPGVSHSGTRPAIERSTALYRFTPHQNVRLIVQALYSRVETFRMSSLYGS